MTATTPRKDGSKKTGCEKVVKTNICEDPKITVQAKMKEDPLKKIGQLKTTRPNFITQAVAAITKSSGPKQLALGTVAGWTAGHLTMKFGRTAAFAIGGSILLFQIAQHTGYVKMDWQKVKEKVDSKSKHFSTKYMEKSPQWRANITRFARGNTYFAAGFAGGFLIGMAS